MRSVWVFSLAKSYSSAWQCRQISSAASCGMMPSARLGARQRRLDVEIFLDAVFVGEDAPHRLGGKDVAEDA